jgi:hypothetical protein
MNNVNLKRWRGLGALIGDAVEHGASAIERVHLATAERPFRILEQIPGIAEPTKGVHVVHDAVVSGVYAQVRSVNRLVGKALDLTFDVLEQASENKAQG